VLPGGHDDVVRDPDGDCHTVHVNDGQSVAEAIENAQFRHRDDD
jgi:hypothetical protein